MAFWPVWPLILPCIYFIMYPICCSLNLWLPSIWQRERGAATWYCRRCKELSRSIMLPSGSTLLSDSLPLTCCTLTPLPLVPVGGLAFLCIHMWLNALSAHYNFVLVKGVCLRVHLPNNRPGRKECNYGLSC